MNDHEFADLVHSFAQSNAEPFRPSTHYSEAGDCCELLLSSEPYYGERIDSLVTVYYGEESGEIVGCLVKGVRSQLPALVNGRPGLKIEIIDGRMKFACFFEYQQLTADSEPVAIVYRKLKQFAVSSPDVAELEVCQA